jgi:flavin-dependent dehydrogenase
MAGDGFALLGDAAGLADPFTGEGIRNAFRSAALLGAAYSPHDRAWPRAYARMARHEFGRDLALSSLLRLALARTRLGVTLVRRAGSSDDAYALVAAILDTLALHDYGAGAFLRRWVARRRGSRYFGPAVAPRPAAPLQMLGGNR